MNFKRISQFTLPLIAGVLLGISFTGFGIGLFCAAAFFTLLAHHQQSVAKGKSIREFGLSIFLSFSIFNIIACSWISNASLFGGISEILINSAIMTAPWLFFAWADKLKGRSVAKLVLFVAWLGMEYLHTNWELEWPWLHLGNAFAFQPSLVQWYKYTGVAGGTAWILLLALSADAVRLRWTSKVSMRTKVTESILLAFLLLSPIIISLTINNLPPKKGTATVLSVQPNFDPYGNDGLTYQNRLSRLVQMTDSAMSDSVELVLWPESAVEGGLWENNLEARPDFKPVLLLSERWPQADFIVGAATFRRFPADSATATSRKLPTGGVYDVYNSLVHIRGGEILSARHKSKLVIGVEKIPFPGMMQYLSSFIDWLGGSVGSLGEDPELVNFSLANGEKTTSLVCYESVFGEYAASKEMSLITIHTNDGWWGNTLGHRQHFAYARLRAIEIQRYVARSAYNGISGFIAPDGSVLEHVPYQSAGAICYSVGLINEVTFYQQNGDFIGRWASFFSLILIVYLFVQSQIGKRR